jgi:hypothetical protein
MRLSFCVMIGTSNSRREYGPSFKGNSRGSCKNRRSFYTILSTIKLIKLAKSVKI